CVQVTHWPYSF
nr:immunoglobulin light chain junction region [Macaca mulatta]